MRERLARLEERQDGDRRLAYLNHETLQQQIDQLRHEVRSLSIVAPAGMAPWIKLGLAILLPFLVYALTGSLEQASRASRIIGP